MLYTLEQNMWREVLKKYKSFKCLWHKNAKKNYTTKECDKAWQELVEMVKEFYVDADKGFVLKRIRNMRCVWLRYRKKIEEAKITGKQCEAKVVYYYDIMKLFYDNLEEHDASSSDENCLQTDTIINTNIEAINLSPDENCLQTDTITNTNIEAINLSPDENCLQTDTIINTNVEARTLKKENIDCDNLEEEHSDASEPPNKRSRNSPATILARRMAEHLEQMDVDQSLIAEKIISDICIYGRLNQLIMESSVALT